MKRMEYALTGNTDVDMQILLDVDKLTLDKSCNVNKYIRSICDNENFWRMKFMHDKFPVLTTNIVNYKREYNKVWELRNKAKNIHLINEIERSRKEHYCQEAKERERKAKEKRTKMEGNLKRK